MYYNNYYPQTQTTNQSPTLRTIPQPMGLKGRPVSSLEEARASTIDFDGSIFFFPDLANKKIYTKQINMDGTATLKMYELKDLPTLTQTMNVEGNFVTKEEFEQALAQIHNLISGSTAPMNELKPVEQPMQYNF